MTSELPDPLNARGKLLMREAIDSKEVRRDPYRVKILQASWQVWMAFNTAGTLR